MITQMMYKGTNLKGMGENIWESRGSGGFVSSSGRTVTTSRSKGTRREKLLQSQSWENVTAIF